MTGKRFSTLHSYLEMYTIFDDKEGKPLGAREVIELLDENEQLKEDLKRCRAWINSDKYDYELTLAFIKNKGYSLKDVLEYEKELKMND